VSDLVITDADNGGTEVVVVGTSVQVVLTSTYWSIDPLPTGTVLRATAPPVTVPEPGHCVTGQGCGTVTVTYTAVAPGTVTVSASRTVCGEALACPPDKGAFRVYVTVR